MRNCKTCGAEYEESLVRCPFCGTAYAPAEEEEYMDTLEEVRDDLHRQVENVDTKIRYESGVHEENMRRFGKRFEWTENVVAQFAKAMEGLGRKAAILVALLVGIIVMSVITSANYADPDEEAKVRRDAVSHADEYAAEAEGLLEVGDYMEFVSFLYAHELMNFPPEQFQRFRSVSYVAKEYYECIELMEEMVLRSDDPDYYDGLDTDIRNFCMYTEGFCEVLEAQKSAEKNEVYLAYMLDMESELHAAMRTYLGMDEAGIREFFDMSRAQKAVKVQEVLRHE